MNKNRKVFNRLLSIMLVLAICITAILGCTIYVSADTEYKISGVNVVYEDNGTASINVHISSAADGEKLTVTKSNGNIVEIDGTTLTDSYYADTVLSENAKMYTLSNLSVTDLSGDLVLTRMVGGTSGTPQTFSLKDYAVAVINEDNVSYVNGETEAYKTADKVVVATFTNYVINAANALSKTTTDNKVPEAVTNVLNAGAYNADGDIVLDMWDTFVNLTFKADSITANDENLSVCGTGINLKDNPYLLITFAISGDYALDKENVVATFSVGNQKIEITANEMINKEGAGRYHLVRLKGIDVVNLHKDVNVSVVYKDGTVFTGTLSVAGFAELADSLTGYEKQSLAAKSLIYYSQALDTRAEIDNQGNESTVYTLTFDANGGSGAPDALESTDGLFEIPSTTPTLTGYAFAGWSTADDATVYSVGDTVDFSNETNTTLYAVWSLAVNIKLTSSTYTYCFTEGMTWKEWCASSYNTEGYTYETNTGYIVVTIGTKKYLVSVQNIAISYTAKISNTTTYTLFDYNAYNQGYGGQ